MPSLEFQNHLITFLQQKQYSRIIDSVNALNLNLDVLDGLTFNIALQAISILRVDSKYFSLFEDFLNCALSRLLRPNPTEQINLFCLLLDLSTHGGFHAIDFTRLSDALYKYSNLWGSTSQLLLDKYLSLVKLSSNKDISKYVEVQFELNQICHQLSNEKSIHDSLSLILLRKCTKKSCNFIPLDVKPHHPLVLSELLSALQKCSEQYHDSSSSLPHQIMLSVDIDYYKIFFPRLLALAQSNPSVQFIVLLSKSTDLIESSTFFFSDIVINSISPNISFFKVTHNLFSDISNQKTFSCCLKYVALPYFLDKLSKDILMLDIDLSMERCSLSSFLEQLSYDQSLLSDFVQTFSTDSNDYASSISAGFLYASRKHLRLYHDISQYIIHHLISNVGSWGIDPAALIWAMARNNLQPIKMPQLSEETSLSYIFQVSEYEQLLKSKFRTY